MIEFSCTGRGFRIGKFEDRDGVKCSVQESSLATEECIWFGVSDPEPKIILFD
jgi:hypothetical protein